MNCEFSGRTNILTASTTPDNSLIVALPGDNHSYSAIKASYPALEATIKGFIV